jgi:membrane-bound serine protease (ClpP class)
MTAQRRVRTRSRPGPQHPHRSPHRGAAAPRRGTAAFVRLRLGAVLALIGVALMAQAASAQSPGEVRVLTIDGMINPITERYLVRNLELAANEGAGLVLIELETPGGLLDATQTMTAALLGARVPTAVYVTPAGGRAASAGVFVTMAAHIAAMAPNTRIGAATPVAAEGGELGEDMRQKIINDTVAYARDIANARGRNADWAESAVRDAAVVGANEALELDVIDLVAATRTTLLAEIDGMTVELPQGEVTLATADAAVVEREMSVFEQLFMLLANPNIALLLLSLGALGIYFELANPGAIIPGVTGTIFLIIAFLSLGTLPLSAAGLALVLLGLVLFGAELFVASGGVLAAGGVISFLLGSLLLIDEQGGEFVEVSLPMVFALTIGMALFVVVALRGVIQVRKKPAYIGGSDMVGMTPVMRTSDHVYVEGERWHVIPADPAAAPLVPGQPVRILGRRELSLIVEPAEQGEPGDRGGRPPFNPGAGPSAADSGPGPSPADQSAEPLTPGPGNSPASPDNAGAQSTPANPSPDAQDAQGGRSWTR